MRVQLQAGRGGHSLEIESLSFKGVIVESFEIDDSNDDKTQINERHDVFIHLNVSRMNSQYIYLIIPELSLSVYMRNAFLRRCILICDLDTR